LEVDSGVKLGGAYLVNGLPQFLEDILWNRTREVDSRHLGAKGRMQLLDWDEVVVDGVRHFG
jgi:hypothetical protein